MIRIVSFKICPFVQRVTALLEAKKVDYKIDFIDLKNKPQWFLDISPTGQVPVLVTEDGEAIHESDAIAEYLDDVYAPLQDSLKAVDRAKERAWSYQASKHYLVQCSMMQSADKKVLAERMAKLVPAFEKVEQVLGDSPFFGGKTFGNVDAAWLVLLHRAQIVKDHSGFDMLANFPKIQLWQQAIMDSGIPGKSVAEGFGQKFSAFYLSDRTFLGRGANFEESPGESSNVSSGGCCG